MSLEEALVHCLRGNGVLFTGAGFSRGAANALPEPDNLIPDAQTFSDHLGAQIGAKKKYPLNTTSQGFRQARGDIGLIAQLLNYFSVTKVAKEHEIIARVPWTRVYTTNYDNCFEFAALRSGSEWQPITIDMQITAAAKRCVHINGHISNLTIQTLEAQIKLTHSSYSADSFADSHWSQQFRQDLSSAKAIIFVGYSMADIDIARVLFLSPELKARIHFIVGPDEEDIAVSPLVEFGAVHRIGNAGLAGVIEKTTVPADPSVHEMTWLKPYASSAKAADDAATIDLLTRGVVKSDIVAWSLGGGEDAYCVRRNSVEEVLTEIDRGKRWFVLHSDIGNGKTVIKEQLSHVLKQLSYAVYWDSQFDHYRKADIRALSKDPGKMAIFVDEAPDRFEVIEGLLDLNRDNVLVFICVRSTLFELGEAQYEDNLPLDYVPLDVNRLTDEEIDSFVILFDKLGLWGSRVDLSRWDKANFIKVECGRGVSRLILSVFENSEVGERITKEAAQLVNASGDVAGLVTLTLLVNRLGDTPTPTLLSDIMNRDVWSILKSKEFRAAGEFIRFQNGIVGARSSVVSQHLLRRAVKPEMLIKRIESYVRRLADVKRTSVQHHIFTQMMRFPVLESMIDAPNKREIMIGFFQSIKELPYCSTNALFWLHYAMARLSFGEFDVAELYFAQAKKLAEGKAKETTDVNNHYARLLLDSRIRGDQYNDYFKAFERAHSILIEQMNKESNRHYPYRQASRYVEFIAHRRKQLGVSERKLFVACCRQVQSALKNIRGKLTGSYVVTQCEKDMARSIELAELSDDGASAI